MPDSLQDQLRALGLAKKKSAGRKKRSKPARGQRQGQPGSDPKKELSLDEAYALRQREEKKQADRVRRRKQAEDRQRQETNRRIRDIVNKHRLNVDEAELARNFLFRGRIRKIHVTPEQQRALNDGELGIAYLSGSYFILSPEHLDAVRAISPDHVVELGGADEDEGDHPVPDDLDW
ncbi:MAG: DUF2058 family protein [Gammaproteobacteria bacterium]|nr:DUF2058 family protein [Gammaproteobacteria bacterium]